MPSVNEQPIAAARPVIAEEEIEAAVRVLRSGRVVQGPEVAAFEEEFSGLVDGRHCVAVNSGTSALHLLLMALGIGPGDEVIVPSFSFAASGNAVRLVGADVVFADIEPGTFCLDPAAVEAAVTPRTAAIMPVHLYGHPAAMDKIMAIADKHSWPSSKTPARPTPRRSTARRSARSARAAPSASTRRRTCTPLRAA